MRVGLTAHGETVCCDAMLRAEPGDHVRIRRIVLQPAERAPGLPPETREVPLELRVNGRLTGGPARLGETVVVETAIGRRFEGELVDLHPRYDHDFGDPQPELLEAARRMRERLS